MACCGDIKRELGSKLPENLKLSDAFSKARIVFPGIISISGSKFKDYNSAKDEINDLTKVLAKQDLEKYPLIIICDDEAFTAASINNFVWVTFTRSNPSHDIYGVKSFTEFKHWGCDGPLVIDARKKPHHAPELKVDPAVSRQVDDFIQNEPSLKKLGL
jgi:4-hydroxy-3-polyprenylbenzoate decarboxylase